VDQETRAYLDDLRRHLDARTDRLRDEIQASAATLRAELSAHDLQVAESLRTELRGHFGVLIEDVRADIRAVAEGVALNNEAIGRLAAEMNARFASAEAMNRAAFSEVGRQIAELRRDVA
jgi:hypothetical protein